MQYNIIVRAIQASLPGAFIDWISLILTPLQRIKKQSLKTVKYYLGRGWQQRKVVR
jgi:hypothetical protein